MAATVRDIKAADFIQKVTMMISMLFKWLWFDRCIICLSRFGLFLRSVTLLPALQFSEHLKKTGKVRILTSSIGSSHNYRKQPMLAPRRVSLSSGSRPSMGGHC
jgi:predicted neutral ceramidase superfamily lipid hydrolase